MTRRQEGRAAALRARGLWVTAASYFFALAFAAVVLRAAAPEGFYRSGLEKKHLPYLVLELPVDSAGVTEGPLAGILAGGDPGSPHDTLMKKQKAAGEEYLRWLRQWSWEGEHLVRRVKGTEYEIYWVPAAPETTQVPIPVGYDYSISGDGSGGFIVTAHKRKEPGLLEALLEE